MILQPWDDAGMRFVIKGKVKPYVRMTQRSKFVDPEAQEYLASRADIQWQLKSQMQHSGYLPYPDKTPLQVQLFFTVPNRLYGCDLDNQEKAVLDAAQGIVFDNDRYINRCEKERALGDGYITSFIVWRL